MTKMIRNGQRNDIHQPPLGALHVFVLAAPAQGVADRHLDVLPHRIAGRLDVGTHVDIADVDVDPCVRPCVFALDRRRTDDISQRGQLTQGDMPAGGGGDEHRPQRRDVIAQLTAVAKIHRVAFQPLYGGRDVHAADGRLDNVLHVAHRQPVAGDGPAIDFEVQVIATHDPLGVDA